MKKSAKFDAKSKLEALKTSRRLMNVTLAAEQHGVSRASIHRWRKDYIEHAEKGLEPKAATPRGRQQPREIVDAIIGFAADHPDWGCIPITKDLTARGYKISSPTVQDILIEHGLGSQESRSLHLENEWVEGKLTPTSEQYRAMLRHNPCLGDRRFLRDPVGARAVAVGVYPLKGHLAPLKAGIAVAIDLSSLFAKCSVCDGSRDRENRKTLRDHVRQLAESFRENREQPFNIVYPSQSIHQPNPFEPAFNIRSIKANGGAMAVGAIRCIFDLLENDFLPSVTPNISASDRMALEQPLQAWIQDYNLTRTREGFPTFGLTPIDCRSRIKAPANQYRALPFDVV